MVKDLLENEKIDDLRTMSIGRIATERDITYREAEIIYNNDLTVMAIAELASCMDISYKEAEKYHEKMVKETKRLKLKDDLKIIIDGLKEIV